MARWPFLFLVWISVLQSGVSQLVELMEADCPAIDVRKELMQLVVDHTTRLTNLIANMSSAESCRQTATVTQPIADVGGIFRKVQNTEDGAIDCLEIRERRVTETGVYDVTLGGSGLTRVLCDMETDGGGWTVFQRRIDGDIDFFLNWQDYKVGFGDVADEFWLGNDNLHLLTSLGPTELRIDFEDVDNNTAHANYSSFWIGDASTDYKLNVSGYSGNASDSLAYHNGYSFTTKDQDNAIYSRNCATVFTGAWWYKTCHSSNLNGRYLNGTTEVYAQGVTWARWKGQYYSLKHTNMMARRIQDKR